MIIDSYQHYIHDLDPIAFSFGFFVMPWYWLVYFLGYFFVLMSVESFSKKGLIQLDLILIHKFMTRGFVFMLLGARLTYILVYNFSYFFNDPKKVFYIWEGGMSFHGALLGVIGTTFFFSRKYKFSFFEFTDPIAVSAPLVLGFGRIANFINGELAGRVTTSKIGVIFPKFYDLNPRHPSQLYEAFFEGFLIFGILFITKKNLNIKGMQSSLFLILYGVFRFFIEFFRMPDKQLGLYFFELTMGQILCVLMVLVGAFIRYHFVRKEKLL